LQDGLEGALRVVWCLLDDEATLAVEAYVAGDVAGRLPNLSELV
jgi:hypothetical protein